MGCILFHLVSFSDFKYDLIERNYRQKTREDKICFEKLFLSHPKC